MSFCPTNYRMNWRLILLLSLLAIVLAVASILGFVKSFEWLMWLIVGIYCGWQFAGRVTDDFFLHGFYLGILDGILNSTAKAIFFQTYLSNNPRLVDEISNLPQDLSPQLVLLIMGPIIGAFSGVAFGVLAFLASKIRKRRFSADA